MTSFKTSIPESDGYKINVHEFDYTLNPGIVYEKNGVVIKSFPAAHTIDGAVNFRIEWNGLCVIIPSWFNRYVSLWGMEKITDRELISTFNFLLKNKILNESHYSNPGFYNQAKVPDWFRDNAIWFGKGLVTEDEFESSFKYLVENRIIII